MKYSSVSAIFALLSSAAAASNENDTVASSKVVFLRGGNKLPRAHVSWGADDDDSAMKMHGENYEDDELEVNAAAAANDNGTAVASSKDKLPRAHISSGVDDDDSAMKMHGEDYEDGLGVNDYKNKDKAYKDGPNTKMPLINGYKDKDKAYKDGPNTKMPLINGYFLRVGKKLPPYDRDDDDSAMEMHDGEDYEDGLGVNGYKDKDKAYKDGPNTKMPLINGYKDKAYKDGPNTKMPLMYELDMSNEDYELEVNVNKEVHGDGWDISGAPTKMPFMGMNDENYEEWTWSQRVPSSIGYWRLRSIMFKQKWCM